VKAFAAYLVFLTLAQALPAAGAPEGSVAHMSDRDVFVHEANYDRAKIPPYALKDPLDYFVNNW